MKKAKMNPWGKKPKGKHQSQPLKKKDGSARKAVPQTPAPADQKPAPSASQPVQFQISEIVIGPNRRKLDKEAVMTIAESMRKLGQLQSIMVRKHVSFRGETTFVLVDGHHRKEAAEALGWTEISAVFFDGDVDDARVYELTQNLQRANITRLYRARCLAELVHRMLGESWAKDLVQPGGSQPGEKGINKTARALGYTRDDIRRSKTIATMSDEAMAKAEELGLDNNESALLRIVKQKPDEQVALAEQLGGKKKRPKKQAKLADKKKDDATYAALLAAWEKAPKCEGAFVDATENAQRKFIRMLQSLAKKDEVGNENKDEDDED
jgi:hypothetical protein